MAKKLNSREKTVDVRPIESLIHVIRRQKVMLDSDLAVLYALQTKSLNLSVPRNLLRFPLDFMFQLNKDESEL